ncbi:hypothetical protein JCM11641_002201 [Rhodosporidiobolus odoratus]
MRATTLLRDAVRPPKAASIVRSTLLELGPMTTQSLHAHLHAPTSAPLPAQVQPFTNSHLSSISPSARRATPHSAFPLPEAPQDGQGWSMSYLKKKILAGLEEKGDIVKITRGKWETTAGLKGARQEAVESVTAGGAGGKGKGKGKVQQSKKEEQEHVWVHRELWERACLRFEEEKQASVKSGEKAEQAETELRSSYGLSGAQAQA